MGGGGEVDPLGDRAVLVPDQLHPQQPPGRPVAGDPQRELMRARVVPLVVVGSRGDHHRVESPSSASTPVTSASGSSSRARSAAEMPASDPPTHTSRMLVTATFWPLAASQRAAADRSNTDGGSSWSGTSSASSFRTRRSMSATMRRTVASSWPFGSSSGQSSYFAPA